MARLTWFRAIGLALVLWVGGLATLPAQADVALNLRDADLRSFVEIVAEETGRNFVLDPQVRGTVTVLASEPMSADALYEVFLNVLELNRLTVIEGAETDRIVPLGSARELSSGKAVVLDGSYQTHVIKVDHISLSEVIEVVRPLLPSEAVLTPLPRSNRLVLSDRGSNFHRIETLIRKLDEPVDETPIELIRLRNADASEVLQVVQSMNILTEGASLSVDRRSNALIVSGPDDVRNRVRVLASRLDTQRTKMSSQVIELSYADAGAMSDIILRSFADNGGNGEDAIRIVPEPQTNALLITAPQERMRDIIAMVRHLDRRPKQVLVEAVIFEMSVDGFADLSAQFGAVLDDAVVGGVQFTLDGRPSLINLTSAVLAGETANPGNGGTIGGVKKWGDDGIGGFLSAVASTSSTRLLSTPSILTLNGQEAEIVVAQNVPFVTGNYSTVGDSAVPENPFQTIERQDIGLTLNVTPQINADQTVRMVIKQEVSSLTNNTSSAGGEITARRALSTTALVRDGNVIMLGGLLEDGSGSVSQRVPGLSKLPFFGGLFRGKNASRNQRVLLVMLRPQVISSDAEARRLTRQMAREARKASLALQPEDSEQYPRTPSGAFPFDGADLNQPFDAGFVDDLAQSRNFPPLPSRLRFNK